MYRLPLVRWTQWLGRTHFLCTCHIAAKSAPGFYGMYDSCPLDLGYFNPFRTAVQFWGQTSQISSSFVPKRDCGSKGVKFNMYSLPSLVLVSWFSSAKYVQFKWFGRTKKKRIGKLHTFLTDITQHSDTFAAITHLHWKCIGALRILLLDT